MLINLRYIQEKSYYGGHGFTLYLTNLGKNWLKNPQKLELIMPQRMKELTNNTNKNKVDKVEDKLTDTIKITFDMFQNKNMSIKEITLARKIEEKTIEEH